MHQITHSRVKNASHINVEVSSAYASIMTETMMISVKIDNVAHGALIFITFSAGEKCTLRNRVVDFHHDTLTPSDRA